MAAVSGTNQFIELELHRFTVAILGILDEEDHQKCNNGGRRVNHELPGIAEVKNGSKRSPNQNCSDRDSKGERAACGAGTGPGETMEPVVFFSGCGGWFPGFPVHAKATRTKPDGIVPMPI